MVVSLFHRFLQMLGLLALQVLVFNHMHILGFATPLVGVALLLYFPLNSSRIPKLFWAFAMGFFVDMFSNTPGMSSAAMVVAAMVQHPLLQILQPKDATDDLMPTYRSMGKMNQIRYVLIIVLAHHIVYFALAYFSFFNVLDLLISAGCSTAVSLAVILMLETLRGHKKEVVA